MTAFGKSSGALSSGAIRVEIRSVNSKGFDASLRIPPFLQSASLRIRSILQGRIERGKIDCTVIAETPLSIPSVLERSELLDTLIAKFQSLESHYHLPSSNPLIWALSTLSSEAFILEEDLLLLDTIIHEAIDDFEKFAYTEGAALQQDLQATVSYIASGFDQITYLEPLRNEEIKNALHTRLSKTIPSDFQNDARFLQEVSYWLDRIDIHEEIVRLGQHIEYFKKTITESSSGKKLQFIVQEILREMTTMGAKANYTPIQHILVDLKSYTEMLKEQLANVY